MVFKNPSPVRRTIRLHCVPPRLRPLQRGNNSLYFFLYLRYNGNENCEVVARGTGDILDILDDALYNKFKKESK